MQPFQNEKAQLIMTLRGMGIVDADVLSAIEQVPREMFVARALQAHAYENASLPIAMDQTISQPYIVAIMSAALQLTGRERVLEIGTGSGYQAAILSFLCRRVYSIERLRPLLVDADNRLREIRVTNVTTRLGDGARGWPEAAPFDRIILTCAPPVIPDMLLNQLKIGGIMVAPVGRDRNQQLVTIRRSESGFEEATLLPVKFVPLVED
ncbi:MAG TPA: protein-L-isoaspartate O-methyltransferase [Alphaproteobacteria bacterium]|jgi:protein-L-isoaspartate(D-aspartate) O-methyltransferase|nr:protein-L-isoaspartate O-methyltransferase [Rhodospirillaceae bacterium]PDH63003.1 MAG: protein-L-isoaspartate O-methyltransferase [SAR116 cluster bacterium MED-G05]HAO57619.1 protein-L-isoaspartate O-methyltransferase [Alphaproteobacteria bacterium]HBP74075.1 protein-L-isoaspartate O-methyltransferase [Alphaproteobacteria bacterium]HCA14308.1 protein-L-isoaspartate O-methyltransferase [Alphaproteobacteria bacterium]